MAKLCEITEALAHVVLTASGYHRHKGEWRKRRVSQNKKNSARGTPAKKDRTPLQEFLETEEGILELFRQAEGGDETVLPALREALDKGPELASICGDLASSAERALIQEMAGKNLLLQEAVLHKLKIMRAELAGPSSTPLEKIMVERVVTCWLAVQHAEMLVAQQTFGKVTVQQVELYQRRLDRSHKRYLSAIRALAQIRKLGPTVQVNIAEQQVNVAQ